MIYLFDTDMLIYMIRYLKSSKRAAQRERGLQIIQRCRAAQAEGNTVGLSAITVSELEYGARHGGDYDREIAAVHKMLAPFVLYDYDSVSCPAYYGHVREKLERKGTLIGSMDLLIAAHALALGATLVSNNVAHFSRVTGLKTINWLAPAGT